MGFPGTPLTDQAREHLQAQVNQIYSMFTNHVRQYRGDDIETSAMQGQLFMGPEAVEAGLIDGVVRNKVEALERFLG
jgi:ClpP class serine protease